MCIKELLWIGGCFWLVNRGTPDHGALGPFGEPAEMIVQSLTSEYADTNEYAQLKTSEFFSFFHVTEVGREHEPDGTTIVRLEPGGFKEFIDIELRLDALSNVRQGRLLLDREWVGDQNRINPFAKDIAKSFLSALAPKADQGRMAVFADALRNLAGTEDRYLKRSQPNSPERADRTVDAEVLHAVGVFVGTEHQLDVKLTASELRLSNIDEEGRSRVQMTVVRRGKTAR